MSVARVGLGSWLGLSVRMISFIDYLLIHLFISNSQHRTTNIYILLAVWTCMEATGEQVGIAHDFGRL